MFGHRYSGGRYFGPRYFGDGGSVAAVDGSYAGTRYFGSRYFGERYFSPEPGPGVPVVEDPPFVWNDPVPAAFFADIGFAAIYAWTPLGIPVSQRDEVAPTFKAAWARGCNVVIGVL